MDNIMGQFPEDVYRVYDLKGSTFQRLQNHVETNFSVLKDLNFLKNTHDKLNVSSQVAKDLQRRLDRDAEFLKSCKLMDYSLLVYFLKKFDEDGTITKNVRMTIYVKKNSIGEKIFELQEIANNMDRESMDPWHQAEL